MQEWENLVPTSLKNVSQLFGSDYEKSQKTWFTASSYFDLEMEKTGSQLFRD